MKNNLKIQHILVVSLLLPMSFAFAMDKQPEQTHTPSQGCHSCQSIPIPQESMPLYKVITTGEPQALAAYLKELHDGGGDLNTHGQDLNVDQHGFAPLNWVLIPELNITAQARIAMLDMLLKAGADINRPSNFGRTAVHDAIVSPLPEARQVFAFLYEKYVLADLIDVEGQTPLHAAVAKGLVEPVTFLLGRKPDLEVRDFKQRTPLQLAFESDLSSDVKAKIVNALVAAGADVNVCDPNNTPLIFQVIKKVDLTGVQLLLYHGVDIHKEDWKYGSMLKYAQQKVESTNNPEIAQKILALVTEYAEKKGITKHCVTIPIPENLQGEIDPAVLQRTVATMLTVPRMDNNKSLLQMAFEASLIKQQGK